MPIKISQLPNNTLPYSGGEEIPLVQSGLTRAGTLSSLVSYLSGALPSDSRIQSLSTNWQNTYTTVNSNSSNWQNTYTTVRSNSANWNNTYTTVRSNSANWNNTYTSYNAVSGNFAVKNANNNFSASQTIVGNLSVASVNIDSIYNVDGTGTSISLSEIDGTGYHSVEVGVRGNTPAYTPIGLSVAVGYGINPVNPPDRSVIIGTYAGNNCLDVQESILIGYGAGQNFGHNGYSNIMIGTNTGSGGGTSTSSYNIFVGHYAGIISNGSNNILIGTATIGSGNDSIVIGARSGSSHSRCLLLGLDITTDEENKIYIGSVTSPYLHAPSVLPLSSYNNSNASLRLKVNVNGVDRYIPLLDTP